MQLHENERLKNISIQSIHSLLTCFLFNNILQMTSKCGKNKNLGHMEGNTKLKI